MKCRQRKTVQGFWSIVYGLAALAGKRLMAVAQKGTVTLIYGARDTEHNNAVALREFLPLHQQAAKKK